MYLRALAGYEKTLGPDHYSTIDTVNNLGHLYKYQQKKPEAEAMFLRAVAGYEKAWGPDYVSTLYTMNKLGELYENQGKEAEAEAMFLRALAGYEKTLGPDHCYTRFTARNLRFLYQNQGKVEAMFLPEDPLSDHKRFPPISHPCFSGESEFKDRVIPEILMTEMVRRMNARNIGGH